MLQRIVRSGQIVGLSGLCSLLIWAGPAYCQTATSTNSAVSAKDAAVDESLQEIVITAEIRRATAQTTAISMSVVTGDQLLAHDVVDMAGMQATTPNFTVNTTGANSAQVNIRGIGINALVPGVTPGVAILRDGLLDAEAAGPSVTANFYDLQSVSVLKGPQGTFIGASAIGGAVEITSRSPTLGGPVSGYVDLQFGNYSDIKTTGAVNLPVSDTLAARLAFNYETQGSFARNVGGLVLANTPYSNAGSTEDVGSDPGHIDNKNVRLSMLWVPTDNFQALLKLENNESQTGGNDEQINPATFVNPITLAVTHAPFYAKTLHAGPWVYDQYLTNQSVYQKLQTNNLELKYTLPDEIVLRSLSGYQNTGVRAYTAFIPPANIYTGYAITGASPDPYYSQEFDIISPSNWPVNFIAGGSWFYRRTALDVGSLNAAASATLPIYTYNPAGAYGSVQRTTGLYANVNWQITDTLQLAVGARDNYDNNFNFGYYQTVNTLSKSTQTFYNRGRASDNLPTGKIGLNWTPSPGQLFYAFAARGYKAAAIATGSSTPTNATIAAPETDIDYELGWKGTAFNGHLRTAIDGFYMNYNNMQEQVWSPDTGAVALANVTSPSKIYGIEAEVDGRFGPVIAHMGFAYTHSALGTITAIDSGYLPAAATNTGQCLPGQAPPACFNYNAVGPTGQGYYVTAGGEENALSPKYMVNGSLGYNFRVEENVLTAEVNEAYVAAQYASIFQQDHYYYMPAYALLGASLTCDIDSWQIEAYGKNLLNRLYEAGNRGNYVFYGNPRQFGLRVQKSF